MTVGASENENKKLKRPKKMSRNITVKKGFNTESQESKKEEYADELEDTIATLKSNGTIAPSPEFIPKFEEMIKLMFKALELSLIHI